MNRYQRNGIVSRDEQAMMRQKKVCVIGCGGLGGYIIEMLARFGIGTITVVDGDVFDETNLNRQLLSVMETIGKSKVFTASERIAAIDPNIIVNVNALFLDQENVYDIIRGHDVVVDALDTNNVRSVVLNACQTLGIPMVYGAIAGWYGQVSTVFPEDSWVKLQLMGTPEKGVEKLIGNPSFTPACIASVEVAEVIKILLGRGELLREKIMFIDLLNNEVEILEK